MQQPSLFNFFFGDPILGLLSVIFILAICTPSLVFAFFAIKSISANIRLRRAPKAGAVAALGQDREARMQMLPMEPRPTFLSERHLGILSSEDLPDAGMSALVSEFEVIAGRSATAEMFFTQLKATDGIDECNSMLIGLNPAPGFRFVAWLRLRPLGNDVDAIWFCQSTDS